MNPLPPRVRLARLLVALGEVLPVELDVLLTAPRFADGTAAVRRLNDPAWADAAVRTMTPEEARWLEVALTARAARLVSLRLPPAIGILGPDEHWIGAEPARLDLGSEGVGAILDVTWEGAEPDGPTAAHLLPAEPGVTTVRARIVARVGDERHFFGVSHAVRMRRADVVLREDRRLVRVSDETGAAAVRVRVEVDGEEWRTDASGIVELPRPLAAGSVIRVGGAPAGRVGG